MGEDDRTQWDWRERALSAEARIAAYEGHLEEWEEIRRLIAESSLGTHEVEEAQAAAPPGIGKAIALGAQYLGERDEARAERDRLRAVVERLRPWKGQALAARIVTPDLANAIRAVIAALDVSGEATDG